MAALQSALFHACCGTFNNDCCNTITGVWYLCLAIILMLILVSCNDILKSRCYFIGFPWSKSQVYLIHGSAADDQSQLLLVFDEESDQLLEEEVRPPAPPPYSMVDETIKANMLLSSLQ
ncbi:uncharacterized protein LOC113206017 isoform X2 [Frankliniella occidentalis]|uniref:Uncharacterized protein LOC113206017 isoform X2 n=1 Tax=Frankliniella occidentalis TaxID=133901 RepID=A0A6J1SGG5_FRAOC|nr:uncharacterized protein LOC113206017 isoform X2 [Frankliniella occidentalis]